MKKIPLFVAFFIACMSANAAPPPPNNQEVKEIITPDIATGFYRTYQFTYDKNMNILMCPMNMKYVRNVTTKIHKCTDENHKNKWAKMENIVPLGKKFVGFKSVNQGTTHFIEVYWK